MSYINRTLHVHVVANVQTECNNLFLYIKSILFQIFCIRHEQEVISIYLEGGSDW